MTSEFLPRCFSTRCTAREYWNPQCLILPDKDGWTSYRWEYQTWVGFKHPSFLTSALKDPTAPLFSFYLFFVLQTHSYFHRSPNACWFDLFYFILLWTLQVMNTSLPQLFQTKNTEWVHLDWLHGCWSRLEGSCLGYLQDAGKGVGGLGPPEGLVFDEWRACDSPFSGALKWVFSFLLKSSLFTQPPKSFFFFFKYVYLRVSHGYFTKRWKTHSPNSSVSTQTPLFWAYVSEKTGDRTPVLLGMLEKAAEKEMATHSRILAWGIPWMEQPGGLPSMGLQSWTQLKRLSMHALELLRPEKIQS